MKNNHIDAIQMVFGEILLWKDWYNWSESIFSLLEKAFFKWFIQKYEIAAFYFYTTKVKVALALSDLVIYTKAEKFRSFQHSRLYQQFNESNSIGETEARKLLKLRGKFLWFKQMKCLNNFYSLLKCQDWSTTFIKMVFS